MALQIGSEKGAHVVVIAEALEDQDRRPQYPMYNLTWQSQYLAVYIRKARDLRVAGRDNGAWALIGKRIAAAYLQSQLNQVRALGRMDTVIGDLNCYG